MFININYSGIKCSNDCINLHSKVMSDSFEFILNSALKHKLPSFYSMNEHFYIYFDYKILAYARQHK